MEQHPNNKALTEMGVTMTAVFIPFSQSRNRAEKSPSLNWLVTILKDGREVIQTDYMQGSGHCPAYKSPDKLPNGRRDQYTTDQRIARECETGRVSKHYANLGFTGGSVAIPPPSPADVFHSLLLDSSAIDAGSFSDWCSEYGYSDDSISARETYDACIAIAVKLRAAFGDKTLTELRELFQDY